MRLENRVALVTGGSRSIGRAICLGLAREGADVAVNYERNAAAAEETAAQARAQGRRAITVQADVADAGQVRVMVNRVLEEFGRIDILVNNAGTIIRLPFLEMTEEAWDRVLDVDLKGVYLVSQAVARAMVDQGGGVIINTSSMSATLAQPNLTPYQSAKAGVYMLTRGMALELAPYHIRVNAIEPGWVETDLNRQRLADPLFRETKVSRIPLGRVGRPEDIAGAAIYLASDESAYATGMALRLDGGQSIW